MVKEKKTWVHRATELIREKYAGLEVAAEEWRGICILSGLEPNHPNGWGALTNSMKRSGYIKDTGRTQKGLYPQTRGSRQIVWRVLKDEDI